MPHLCPELKALVVVPFSLDFYERRGILQASKAAALVTGQIAPLGWRTCSPTVVTLRSHSMCLRGMRDKRISFYLFVDKIHADAFIANIRGSVIFHGLLTVGQSNSAYSQ